MSEGLCYVYHTWWDWVASRSSTWRDLFTIKASLIALHPFSDMPFACRSTWRVLFTIKASPIALHPFSDMPHLATEILFRIVLVLRLSLMRTMSDYEQVDSQWALDVEKNSLSSDTLDYCQTDDHHLPVPQWWSHSSLVKGSKCHVHSTDSASDPLQDVQELHHLWLCEHQSSWST